MEGEKDLEQLLTEFIETGNKYELMHQETITTLANKLDNLTVSLSQKEKESVAAVTKDAAKRGVSEGIKETPAKVPSSSQIEPVLKTAMNNIGPETSYKIVLKNKKYFWITLVLFLGWLSGHIYDIYQKRTFDGTAESWANRMYVAAKEIGEKNPGNGYDEVMTAFANGNAENAKELVVRKENKLAELQDHRGKYEKKISEYLSNVYPSGIRIIEFEETTAQRKVSPIFNLYNNYNFVYIKAVTFDEQIELRIAMERLAGFPGLRDAWDIYVTTDTRINSIADYRQKADKVKWLYSDKKAIPML